MWKEIVLKVWGMLGEGGLRPKNSKPKHLHWALYFLKVYPREGPGCSAVGGSKGAIDPKTMQKWVWLFLECIAKLADDVVSKINLFISFIAHCCLILLHCLSSQTKPQIVFESRLINDVSKQLSNDN
jgi:hypothetical protein